MPKISTYAIDATPTVNDKVVGTEVGNDNATKNYTIGGIIALGGSKVTISVEPPATADATGASGDVVWTEAFIYVCTSTNTWKRVAIATWT